MLHLHRSERADALVEALAGILAAQPLADPLQPEVISVPTRGVERWLTQRLSHRLGTSAGAGREDGVCANVEFPFPGRLVGDALAAATGIDRDNDPWRPERAVWPLIEILDAHLEEPWLKPVRSHLYAVGAGTRRRRFSTARHVSDLFDHYAIHRPWMVQAWLANQDVDGAGNPLDDDRAWQAELWRRLHARIAAPSPAERLADACIRLRDEPELADEIVPARFAIFGLTRLPASYLEVLRALADHRGVHLFLLHPSAALWDRVRPLVPPGRARRENDPTRDVARNPLLRSWGRDAREMQLVVSEGAAADTHHALDARDPSTLLERIQHAVRNDEPPPPPHERPPLAGGDRTIQVHSCHGRARQVEVLRDAVLHLLAGDPTLEPRDVIVMCPDIEDFAPLIHATFGAGDVFDHDPHDDDHHADPAPTTTRAAATMPDLRVRLADRALRQTNPVLGAVADLLEIAAGRVTAPEVIDFASREPVRRRFGFDDDDIARLKEWVAATGIRWGLDAHHRRPWLPEGIEANTWRAGLDRVLAGVAMAEEDERLIGAAGVLPLDDVDSGSIDLAGRFAELVERLAVAVTALAADGGHPAEGWTTAIATSADELMLTTDRDAWQRSQLQRLLDDFRKEAGTNADDVSLELAEVRALLADRLRGQPTRANFRTGHLTVCTLVPMRSVPHRVVCLLGLDDGAFPRQARADGDDLIAADPYVGDRDGRGEDRQLLLDALLAAKDHLVITYAGRDERTNARRPPAVPVGELLDLVERTVEWRPDDESDDDGIVRRHPLQPFDPKNFATADRRSFDLVNLDGARAMAGHRASKKPFLADPLPPPPGSDVLELDALVRFAQHPVKAFLRQRLHLSLGDWSEDIDETIPVALGPLEAWAIGDRVADRLLAGADLDACIAAERARGHLPPGRLGDPIIAEIAETARCVATEAASLAPGAPRSAEVRVRLADGRVVVGTVPGLVGGTTLRAATYSRLAPKHRLTAWVRLVALAACRPDTSFTSVVVGRTAKSSRTKQVGIAEIDRLEAGVASSVLRDLVDLYDRGMAQPLPLYCKTSAAYAAGGDAYATWTTTDWKYTNEDDEDEHRLVFGGRRPFADIAAELPHDDEKGDGWDEEEPTRFGRYARRLWAPLLAVEQVREA